MRAKTKFLGAFSKILLTLAVCFAMVLTAVPAVEAAPAKYVKSLTLSKEKASVEVGKTSKVKATVAVKGSVSKNVTVKSSDTSIATVSVGEPNSNGVSTVTIKGKKKGSATITVKTKGKDKNSKALSKKITVNVKKAVDATQGSDGYVTDFYLRDPKDGYVDFDNKAYINIELSRTNKVSYSQIGSITISDPSAFEVYKIEEAKNYIENKKATGYRYDLEESRIIVKALKPNSKATLTVTTKDNGKNGKPIVDSIVVRSTTLNDRPVEGQDNWVGYEKLSFDEASVLSRIMALQEQYPQGSKWDGTNGYVSHVPGMAGGHACYGFASMLSDAAFYDAPLNRKAGGRTLDEVRVGDVICYTHIYQGKTYAHAVVVLSVDGDKKFTTASGNTDGKVDWNYKVDFSDSTSIYPTEIRSRYPD